MQVGYCLLSNSHGYCEQSTHHISAVCSCHSCHITLVQQLPVGLLHDWAGFGLHHDLDDGGRALFISTKVCWLHLTHLLCHAHLQDGAIQAPRWPLGHKNCLATCSRCCCAKDDSCHSSKTTTVCSHYALCRKDKCVAAVQTAWAGPTG